MSPRPDYIYDDDPGPAPGSVPLCPVCSAGADKAPDVVPVPSPPGFMCRHCGWWISPTGGRLTAKQRELWAEATRKAPA